ncbi:MAG TPA: hypothetical protein VNU66_10335, partial [Mycobacteriales bacterium]|nr:hypothetical protein [Mycobacteriales bacterium]
CRGAVRPDAPWCTQCWADLRPAPEPEPEQPEPAPAAAPAGPRHGAPEHLPVPGAPAAATGEAPGWPCGTCGAVNGLDLDACAACGAGFLTALRAEEPPLLVLPGVGDVTRLGRGQRLALAAGVALVLALLVGLLGLLTG